ncbi:hypothetical protein ACPCG0_02630 [Propionibacteriaceae bacterium Y1923]|uniref:hypothetical protein n=1 Tax=Aestuariimicrobium sp. Y1814 TaxID=3418742 RepID=UPI003C23B62E
MSDQSAAPGQGQFPGSPQGGPQVFATPLVSADPPRIDGYWLDARLAATPSGVAYAAHDDDGTSVMLVVLAAGAAGDAAARDRFAGEVNMMHLDTVLARGGQGQDSGRLAEKYVAEQAPAASRPQAPWVVLAYDGSPAAVAEANRLLSAVDLSRTRLIGAPTGPGYQLHWLSNTNPGTSRLWPLPWPGRHDRAGWVTTLVSWLLALLLAAMALLIAVLAFQNTPPSQAPPPIPTENTEQSPQSPQSPESSQSGSPDSQSPSSDGSDGTPSHSPSMDSPQPSGSESGGGSPSPNQRLILDQGDR